MVAIHPSPTPAPAPAGRHPTPATGRRRSRRTLAAALTLMVAAAGCASAEVSTVPPDPAGLGAGGTAPVGDADPGPVQGGGYPDPAGGPAQLTDVRAAGQDGFDRIVLEFADTVPGYRVSYTEPPVREAGSGAVVPIEGQAFLQIRTTPASTVDLSGDEPRTTYSGPDRLAPPRAEAVTEVVRTGDVESQLTWTAGVTDRLPYAVQVFRGPPRLVVDVLHESGNGQNGDGQNGDGDGRLRPIGEAGTDDVAADGTAAPVTLTDVRLGAHDGFDRIVLETAGGGRAGWEIGYTDRPRAQGSGAPIEVPGAATLGITLTNVALPGDAPPDTAPWDGPQRQRIEGAQVLTELVEDTLYEGRYAFYAGLTGTRPFAVGRLDDPQRIVVDVLTGQPAPDRPVALTQRCDGPATAVSYPQGWSTNPGDAVAPCTRFAPQPIDPQPETDARAAPIAVSAESTPYFRLASPDPATEQDRAVTVVDGRQAVRIERVATGEGLYPQGTPTTSYLIDLSEGVDDGPGTLVANAVGIGGTDHERDVAVLDRMVRTMEITAGSPAEESVVAAYSGGGGAFTVTATTRDGQVCLRIPPDGAENCVAPPAATEVATVPLTLVGDRQVTAGVAGDRVFRVEFAQTDGDPLAVLPAPVPDSGTGGFAVPLGPAETGGLTWSGPDGSELGSR
ncbi:hypothetical protein [Pseudonocardia sp.]|uniref:AMIN-like domain-containing (lipo)protein n=1 Tax=Pseudonocardia sp. TaxID=60912 RepID=UPI0026133EC6|nr:hypothetical protein [Pseudonocardia sp.]